jgi:hypothetical protein
LSSGDERHGLRAARTPVASAVAAGAPVECRPSVGEIEGGAMAADRKARLARPFARRERWRGAMLT